MQDDETRRFMGRACSQKACCCNSDISVNSNNELGYHGHLSGLKFKPAQEVAVATELIDHETTFVVTSAIRYLVKFPFGAGRRV